MRNNILIGILVIVVIVVLGLVAKDMMGSSSSSSSDQASTTPTTAPATTDKVKIEDLVVGTGKEAKSGDTVVVSYKGMLQNGTVFDDSANHGGTFTTQIGTGQVIKGWDEGIPGMKVGGKRRLTIPPSLGYGDQQAGSIPPNSTLIFEVQLVDVK